MSARLGRPGRRSTRLGAAMVAALLALSTFLVGTPAAAIPPVENASVPVMVVLDASGSMNQSDAPGPRIDAAKSAVRTLVDGLPADAQVGLMDYGILNTLQVDQHGNINSTAIGEYGSGARRFGGPGGADTIAAQCWRTILMTDQEKRKFVSRVDFISSPGFLDGSDGAREAAGLPSDTGPYRVVTPWAAYDYDNRKLRLVARAPWVSVEEIFAECEHPPLVADDVTVLDTPTEEELNILRTELDPRGQNTGERAGWVVYDEESGSYTRADG